MQFSVLGPLEATDDGTPLPLGGPRQRSVLALLLLHAGHVVAADRLVTEIWGDDPPDGARDSLYTYVSNLRGVLGRERIARSDGGYRFAPLDGDAIDADEFTDRLTDAHRLAESDPEAARERIDESLLAWRGRPYEGLEDLPSIAPEVARLEELRLRAVEERIEAELRAGTTPETGAIEALVAEHPYRERFWELLARALYRAGRQTDALRTLSRLRRLLLEDLGIEPSTRIVGLEERILLQDSSLDADTAPPSNVPIPMSSFVGRVDELDTLERLIDGHRLVTVTGPGGAGKTRLVSEVATRISGSFPDGVWFVDLAAVERPDLITPAVAATLGLAGAPDVDIADAIASRVRRRTMMLILDNCEHVADEAGALAERLLAAAPNLRIVATSRRPLGPTGEALVLLAGLDVSSESEDGDADRLFAARAADVRPGFALDDGNRAHVASICRHLDGMPLAIELAAARADALSPAEIDRHLDERFRLLADMPADRAAHRSLRASLDWSRDLLDPEHRRAFDLLGVFEGPFTAAAAAAVLGAPTEADGMGLIRRLVTASLVQVVPGEVTRYRLLETTRLYTRSHLRDAGSWNHALDLHDEYYHRRCQDLRERFFGSGRPGACRTIEAELADFEAAFDRYLDRSTGHALEMAWPLGHVWLFSGRLGNGIDRLGRLVDLTAGAVSRQRADALAAGCFLLMYVTRYPQSIAWADEAIGIYRAIGEEQGLAYTLARRGHLAFSVGDVPGAMALLQESLAICERIEYREGTAWPLTLLGQARLWAGDQSDEVRHMLEEGRRRFIVVGDTYGQMHANMFIPNVGEQDVATQLRFARESVELANRPDADPLIRPVALHNLAYSVWNAGERERAIGQNRLSARAALETGATISSGMAFLQAGFFEALSGDPERAAVLYGAGDAHFVMQMPPFYERQIRPGIEAATAALGDDRYRQLHDDGAAMSIEAATDFLLRA